MTSDIDPAAPGVQAPADLDALRAHLAGRDTRLPKRLAQVASFLLAHPEEVAFGTVASLADRAGVQPSALVRMAKSVGFSGFSELQALFRERLRQQTSSYGDRLSSAQARNDATNGPLAASLLGDFGQLGLRSICRLMETIEPDRFEAVVAMLARADTIFLIGRRRSHPVAAYLSYLFGTLGIRHTLLGSPLGTDAETVALASDRDAMLAITFAPYAPETFTYARQAVERDCPLVLLTDSPLSPLVARSRHWVELVEADLDGFRTVTATFTLAAALAVAVASARRLNGI